MAKQDEKHLASWLWFLVGSPFLCGLRFGLRNLNEAFGSAFSTETVPTCSRHQALGNETDPILRLKQAGLRYTKFLQHLKDTWKEKIRELQERCPRLRLLDPQKLLQVIQADRLEETREDQILAVHQFLWHCFPDIEYNTWFERQADCVGHLVATMGGLHSHWTLPENLLDGMPNPQSIQERMQKALWRLFSKRFLEIFPTCMPQHILESKIVSFACATEWSFGSGLLVWINVMGVTECIFSELQAVDALNDCVTSLADVHEVTVVPLKGPAEDGIEGVCFFKQNHKG